MISFHAVSLEQFLSTQWVSRNSNFEKKKADCTQYNRFCLMYIQVIFFNTNISATFPGKHLCMFHASWTGSAATVFSALAHIATVQASGNLLGWHASCSLPSSLVGRPHLRAATHGGNRELMAHAKPVRCLIYIARRASPCLTSQGIYAHCAGHCSCRYLNSCSPSLILQRHVAGAPNDSNPIVAPPPRKRTTIYPNLESKTETYYEGVYLVQCSVMFWFH